MDELRELYQATILDHNRKPRNFRVIEEANRHADGHNPICGDKLVVSLNLTEEPGDRCRLSGHRMRDFRRLGFPNDRFRSGEDPAPRSKRNSNAFIRW